MGIGGYEGHPGAKEVIEVADDQVVMAGLVDSHVHVNEPGRTEWEGFETATKAAAAGGVTTIIGILFTTSSPLLHLLLSFSLLFHLLLFFTSVSLQGPDPFSCWSHSLCVTTIILSPLLFVSPFIHPPSFASLLFPLPSLISLVVLADGSGSATKVAVGR